MTTFLLVRHAAHDWLSRGIGGRLPDISLNDEGRTQAEALVQRLEKVRIDAICCSPQPRTHETVAPLAAARGLPVETDASFDEVDFGRWTGMAFEQLKQESLWDTWVHRKSMARPPGGEAFAGVPHRALAGIERLRGLHPDRTVLVLSHGDVIKALLAFYLGMSLDSLGLFDISPASVSIVDAGEGWSRVRLVNGLGVLPPE